MALIGVIADRDCKIVACNLSEVHYVLCHNYSYITMEFAVTADENIHNFILCIHGTIETSKDKIRKLETSRSYSRLFQLSDCHLTASNGIYDFRATWGLDAMTNQCYEGPSPFNQISVRITNQEIVYYGCSAYIPETTYEAEVLDSCTLITISRKDGSDFEAGKFYVFRLGFFLRWPRELLSGGFAQVLKRFLRDSRPINYSVHTLSEPPESETILRRRTDIKNRLEKSSLCIDLSPFTERYAQENTESPMVDILSNWADTPTSDLWIVISKNDTLDVLSELLEGITELSPSVVRYGLYTHQSIDSLLPYKEYHIKYKRNIRPLMGIKHMDIKTTRQIPSQLPSLWRITMENYSLRTWFKEAIGYSGILAVLLAISYPFVCEHGYLLQVFIGLPLSYLAVILGIGLLRYR